MAARSRPSPAPRKTAPPGRARRHGRAAPPRPSGRANRTSGRSAAAAPGRRRGTSRASRRSDRSGAASRRARSAGSRSRAATSGAQSGVSGAGNSSSVSVPCQAPSPKRIAKSEPFLGDVDAVVVGRQAQVDLGMRGLEGAQPGQQPFQREAADRAQGHHLAAAAGIEAIEHQGDPIERFAQLGQQAPGPRRSAPARAADGGTAPRRAAPPAPSPDGSAPRA